MHVKLHISVCDLFMQTGRRRCLYLSLICRAYAFRFSGDRREFILLPSFIPPPYYFVATMYVVPSRNAGSAKGSSRPLFVFLSR